MTAQGIEARTGQDAQRTYKAADLVWKDDGGSWCPIAVMAASGGDQSGAAWNPKSGGY